jgi:hypothetical protein
VGAGKKAKAAAEDITGDQKASRLRRHHLRSALTDEAVAQADDSDELSGVQGMYRGTRDSVCAGRSMVAKVRARRTAEAAATTVAEGKAGAAAKNVGTAAKSTRASKAAGVGRRMQARRTWLAARKARETTVQAGAAAVRSGGTRTLAAAISSALAPLSGILTAVVCFVLSVLLISQMVSALFGFWENEDSKRSIAGLPPYITTEMVEAALQCQADYGHPAGCTIAQIICESGVGDHLSGLATRDNNLFGIKWASSYGAAPEVTGKSAWSTGEEYDGQQVTIMADFTSFRSYRDCIVFRSRVLLQNARYADNALIREAIATHSSDRMAEGLKDAGYATSSSYVDSLKGIMSTYNLYRFDTMTVEEFRAGTADGNAVVAAAQSQLGVPYVWGGTTPGVGLDCSGLTQYCYAQAGKAIPRTSEDQHAGGTSIPLSEARPGDILWKSGHVAIYIGGDQYIHEPQTGDVCKISTGINHFTCAVRY